MKNVRNQKDFNLIRTKFIRNHLVSEPKYDSAKYLQNNLLTTGMKMIQMIMDEAVFFRILILEISKLTKYEFWYKYRKPKYVGKAKLCYMDKSSLMVSIKTEELYVDIKKDVEARFDTPNYELERPLSRRKIKKLLD